jgi:negative regulator of sigma E activity
MNFEDELRTALQREPAPPDFAARVLSKTPSARTRVLPFWRRPATLAMAAALAVAALVPSAVYQYRRQQRAIEARDQLIEALAITKVQLLQVGEKIRQNKRQK